jgi:5-methylcytosine-specific restriction endonuclease McrA
MSREWYKKLHNETKICPICKKEFTSYKCYNRIFCSQLCNNKSRPDRGGKIVNKCKICGNSFTPKVRGLRGRNTVYCSDKCKSIGQSKSNHWNWKGGISKNHRRETKEYIDWRNSIYRKDKFICQVCKKHCKDDIVAHHIKSWNNFPELRYDLQNGMVLCRSCHIKEHKVKVA